MKKLDLSQEQVEALKEFAALKGRTWKSKLLDQWLTGRYSGVTSDEAVALQQLRNTGGPQWLKSFKLSELA